MKIIEGFDRVKAALARKTQKDAAASDDREESIRQIVNDVRRRGDAALFEYTQKFDNVKLTSLEVPKAQVDSALNTIDKELRKALELAAERITAFHIDQKHELLRNGKNKKLGWLVLPLEKAGILAPGAQAPLPSTVLMTAIPAKVAGIKELVLVTPPTRQGSVSPVTLAAAALAGIDRVFSIGGAQAVAALAYGTETVPKVDKVCGPGSIYGQLAKKMVYGDVGIDGLYGPSEVIIIADDTANPVYCAADLLAQAEHGSGATAIMLTNSREMADKVKIEFNNQLTGLSRQTVISGSLEDNVFIGIVDTILQAVDLANDYAPEHLCLVMADASSYIDKVKNTGCLFIGENSIEAIVDYVAGPSHVLPTEGTARFGSGLNILNFVKLINVVNLDSKDIRQLGNATSIIARAEGLDAHARAVARRLENMGKGGS